MLTRVSQTFDLEFVCTNYISKNLKSKSILGEFGFKSKNYWLLIEWKKGRKVYFSVLI